jgi:hypothetical protein
MQVFLPRQVDGQAPMRWWRQALGLVARRPVEWAAIFAAQLVAAGFAAIIPDLPAILRAIAGNLMLIAIGTRLAAAADRRPDFNRASLAKNLAAIAGIGLALVLLEIGLTSWLIPRAIEDATGDLLMAPLAPGLAGAIQLGLPLTWCLWLALMSCGLAFLPALLLANGYAIGVRTACLLSLAGTGRNIYAYMLAISLIDLLLALVPFGGIGGPIMAAVSYVAFRDIFLGIAENAPRERVRAAVLAPARG